MARYIIKDKAGQKPVVEHMVNLQLKNQSIQLVRSCCISLSGRWFYQSPKGEYELSVDCKTPDSWIKDAKNAIMKIGYGGKVENRLTLAATANTVDFQLYFDPNQILDCQQKEGKDADTHRLVYTIYLKSKDGKTQYVEESGEITVRFAPVSVPSPVLSFVPNEKGKDLTYSVLYEQPFEIGHLTIRHPNDLMRSPACDVYLTAIAKVKGEDGRMRQIDDLISFGQSIKQSNPRYLESGIAPTGTDGSDFTYRITGDHSVDLKNIDVNKKTGSVGNDNIVSIPIMWNMPLVSNPDEDIQEYTIYVEAKYQSHSSVNASSSTVFYDHMKVALKKNLTMMDLEVSLKEGRKSEIVANGSTVRQRVPDMVAGAFTAYTVTLRNTAEIAEHNRLDAKIYVKDFKCELPKPGRYAVEKEGSVKESLFSEDSRNAIGQGTSFAIPIKGSSSFTFCYDHTCISEIISDTNERVYQRVVKIPVKFSYYIDKEDVYSSIADIPTDDFAEFFAVIPVKIQKAPSPEWLCLDFGTSAVVATYAVNHFDAHGKRVNCLLPLRETKQKLLRGVYSGDRDNLKNILQDTTETDVNLIASDIVIDDKSTTVGNHDIHRSLQDVRNYKDAPFKFSPSSGLMDINTRKIPSLKSLMGNRTIPADLMPNRVSINGELSVNKVFEAAYRQLFELFLPNDVKDTNRLVMTIPNTYAPSHVQILRQVAMDSLPELRPDYIRFMSESDAVAFYYLSRRADLMEGTELDEGFDKNVLVYDMGAGTLDITYFTRKEAGEKYEIEMKGKMGVSRAGNYMDYILAKVVVDLLKPIIQDSALKEKLADLLLLNNYVNRDADAASELKRYVRDIVKPMLNSPADTSLPALKVFNRDLPTAQVTVGQILSHECFKEYLNDASVEVFKHFRQLFSGEGNEINPNLVIFSGRTTSLRVLRKSVKDALSVLSENPSCVFLDLSGEEFSNDVENEVKNVSSLKTAVVGGAFSFCADFASGKGDYILKNKNVYAQYGLIFKNGDQWRWEKLIDTNTQPVNATNPVLTDDGMTIYEYDSDQYDATSDSDFGKLNRSVRNRDFTSVSLVYVVQSYSADTLKDWKECNHDMISVIGYADLKDLNGVREYSITIDSSNQVNFHIGSNQMPLHSHDAYDSESFKMSMWPIVR